MKTFDTIFNSIMEFGTEVCLNFFIYGFVGSMFGLIWSIYLIRRWSRAGKFNRPNSIWAFLVGFNKFYLPIVTTIFLGFLIGTYGVNSAVNDKIEESIHVAIQQMDLNKFDFSALDTHMKGQVNLEEILVMEMSKGNGNVHENTIIAKSLLKEMNYPKEIDELVIKLRETDWTVFNKGLNFGISYFATEYVDGIFWMAYRFLFVFVVLGFLKLPIIECVVYTVYKFAFEKDQVLTNSTDSSVIY